VTVTVLRRTIIGVLNFRQMIVLYFKFCIVLQTILTVATPVLVYRYVVSMYTRYLMTSERMRYADALEYVRMLRPDVRPNEGFQRQLKAFDSTVRH